MQRLLLLQPPRQLLTQPPHLLLLQPLRQLLLPLSNVPTAPVQTGVATKNPAMRGFFVGSNGLTQFCCQQFENSLGLCRLFWLTIGVQDTNHGLTGSGCAQADAVFGQNALFFFAAEKPGNKAGL